MYDEKVKTIDLTSDEIEILSEMLFYRLESCTSIGEDVTVRDLLDKIKE